VEQTGRRESLQSSPCHHHARRDATRHIQHSAHTINNRGARLYHFFGVRIVGVLVGMVAYGHAVVGPLDGRLRRIALHAQHVVEALSLVCPGSGTGGRRSLLSLLLGSLLLFFAFSFACSLQLCHSFPFLPLSLLALPSLLLRPV
jgi:hypothetical protein